MSKRSKFYITSPIYYVNDRPHIGHLYTTTVADIVARYHRLKGDDVFFLTGTDEHAAKVVDSAAERGMTPQQWADENAHEFENTFARLGMTHDDFIRTSQERHKQRVRQYVKQLLDSGDVYLGEYEGWYDAGQEEYVAETKAKESDYKSPINGRPLVRKREKNYFFKLSNYGDDLLKLLDSGEVFDVQPLARKNEVIARIREGLNDVPISRTGASDWGIKVPGDQEHTIYVWIDALFSYLSTVDTDQRRRYWPANVHLIGKEILWFHAVIWPAMLTALKRQPGNDWIELPRRVYAHSFWISEGQKMSKSLGNFIDLTRIDHYVKNFGMESLRYFLATNGPMGAADSNFSEARFIEVYNSDLANALGNCASRVTNMTGRYFSGKLPAPGADVEGGRELDHAAQECVPHYKHALDQLNLAGAVQAPLDLVRAIDSYIDKTQPFKLAKDPQRLPEVATILYNCAEALRIASVLLWPILPGKIEALWQRLGCGHYTQTLANRGQGDLDTWTQWGQLKPGTETQQGEALFPRYQVKQ